MTRQFTAINDGLVSEEISWEEYLEACAGSLAGAKLIPMPATDDEPAFVTINDRTQRLDEWALSLVPKH